MTFLGTLLSSLPYINWPTLAGWSVWLFLLGLVIWLAYRWRNYNPAFKTNHWLGYAGLVLFAPLTTVFIGLQLTSASSLPLPGLPTEVLRPAMMVFSALPWILAGGLLGPLPAASLGLISGLFRSLWGTHSIFTPLDLALIGLLFSVIVRQRYRTFTFRLLRQPIVAGLVMVPVYAMLYLLGTSFSLPAATLTARLDYALSSLGTVLLATTGELLIAGLFAQVIAVAFPMSWGLQKPLQPSPAERSLETRFVVGTGALITLLLLTLLAGDWIVAGNAARNMLHERLANTAQMASESVPYFLETGQNLGTQMAGDPRLLAAGGAELSALVGEKMQFAPYFDQVVVIDPADQSMLGGYPEVVRQNFTLYPDESAGIGFAVNGVPAQIYAIPPADPGGTARVSFLIGLTDSSGQVRRVLLGRTGLATNPLTQPLLNNLDNLKKLNGSGLLLDDKGRILYATNASQVMDTYQGKRGNEVDFYDDAGSSGTRELVYYQPVVGHPWAVVLSVPAQQAQQLALNIAAPLSVMIVLLALVALISLRFGLRVVTGSLQNLASEANRITQGNLDHPLQVDGADEVGQLRRSFEQMRSSLKDRMDELNQLLVVSQGVASSLDVQDAVQPVLEALSATGANAVRVVLSPTAGLDPTQETLTRFAVGPMAETYAPLDEQIMGLTLKQDILVLPNLGRARAGLQLDQRQINPGAILAVALRHETLFYGVLWTAFDQPHNFSESEVRFNTTLASQAALAAANAHLFQSAEVGRKQMEAILDSTPDPVLVTDNQNRLLLANPAAVQLLGPQAMTGEGKAIEKTISQRELFALLQASSTEKQSAEITFSDGQVYLATASSVVAEGQPVGRVCILRDVTHLKELDTLKSDFVATVSHDLRSPLTLLRGYATMLEMVGELNEQQKGYASKIVAGVENMSRLVNNLLDLGRIEIGVGLQIEAVPVLDILDRVTSALQLQASQKEITLEVETPRDMPRTVEADQALLHQAVYNLVENALKYTPNRGRVTVRVRPGPDSLTFEVTDTGIGISPPDLPHLFEKFYRGKQREARAQHGTGLGLAIVHSIVERHGGRVWVESELGQGSTFFLRIPLTQPKESRSV